MNWLVSEARLSEGTARVAMRMAAALHHGKRGLLAETLFAGWVNCDDMGTPCTGRNLGKEHVVPPGYGRTMVLEC